MTQVSEHSKPREKFLLYFAHKGEASEFLRHHAMVRSPVHKQFFSHPSHGLYTQADPELLPYDILIGGAGYINTVMALSSVLAATRMNYEFVLNLGLAAGLREFTKPGQSFSVKHVLNEETGRLRSEAFDLTLPEPNPAAPPPSVHSDTALPVILITTDKPLNHAERAKQLSFHADLVDMEAHAAALVCRKFKLPVLVRKTVSDVGHSFECRDVATAASHWSSLIFADFNTLNLGRTWAASPDRPTQHTPATTLHEQAVKSLRLTRAESDLCLKIFGSLEKTKIWHDIASDFDHLLVRSARIVGPPKKQRQYFLNYLKQKIDPSLASATAQLQARLAKVSTHDTKLSFNGNFESPSLNLRAQIRSDKERLQLINTLSSLEVSTLLGNGEPRV